MHMIYGVVDGWVWLGGQESLGGLFLHFTVLFYEMAGGQAGMAHYTRSILNSID